MEDPPEEAELRHALLPHSQREIHSLYLLLSLASSGTESKQILDSVGLTVEEFRELFGPLPGPTGHDDG